MPLFDAASSLAGMAVSSLTFSHVNAGDYIFVGAGNYQPGTQVVNTVTFNGDSLTEIHESAGADMNASIWERIAPDIATGNVVATWSASADEVCAGAVSFTGVHQTTPRRGTYALATGTSTAPTVDIASAVNDMVIDFLACSNPNGITAHASQVERWSREDVDGYSSYGSSTEAGAATTTMSWTLTASTEWRIYAVSLQPSAGGTIYEVAITESTSATEIVNSSGNIFSATRTEAGTATEVSDRLLDMAAAITEAISATESPNALRITLAAILEAVSASESSSGLTTSIAAILEAANATDESNFLGAIYEAEITEVGTATDNQSALLILAASILEAITSEDVHNALKTTIADIIEINTAEDLSNATKIVLSSISEATTAEDIISGAFIIVADIIESGIPLDSFDSLKIAVASIIEAGSASDYIDATHVTEEIGGGFINVEFERRKREKERLELIRAEDEELMLMVAAAMVEVNNRWVH